MRRIYKDLTEINELIAALKASVDERQKIIDDLIEEGIKKDKEIKLLEQKLAWAESVTRRLRKK